MFFPTPASTPLSSVSPTALSPRFLWFPWGSLLPTVRPSPGCSLSPGFLVLFKTPSLSTILPFPVFPLLRVWGVVLGSAVRARLLLAGKFVGGTISENSGFENAERFLPFFPVPGLPVPFGVRRVMAAQGIFPPRNISSSLLMAVSSLLLLLSSPP